MARVNTVLEEDPEYSECDEPVLWVCVHESDLHTCGQPIETFLIGEVQI